MLVDQEFEAPGTGTPVGTGGQQVWTFKAVNKDVSTIPMEYSRPWEGGEKAAETFDRMAVGDEMKDLFFRTYGDATEDWKSELRARFEELRT